MSQRQGHLRQRIETDVPIVLNGYVYPNDQPSFCRDGADFWVETVGWRRHVRVCAADPEAALALSQAAQHGDARVLSGHLKRGPVPGCDLLEVHAVEPLEILSSRRAVAA